MLGNHLIGIYEKAMPPEIEWHERLANAALQGFDFVELSIDESDERIDRLSWSARKRGELASAMENTGVGIRSMCLSAHRRFPLGSGDASVREKAREIAGEAIRFALEFGIRVIQVAGYDVYYEPSTSQTRAAFLEGLSWFVEEAEKHQVMLAMEIMDTGFLSSITAYLKIKEAIPSPWLSVYPDIGNLSARNGNVLPELEAGKNDIVAVHLKDTLAPAEGFAGKFREVPFGSGCVDFPAVFGKLERIGFRGPYMIEMWHRKGMDANREMAAALSFIRVRFEEGTRP